MEELLEAQAGPADAAVPGRDGVVAERGGDGEGLLAGGGVSCGAGRGGPGGRVLQGRVGLGGAALLVGVFFGRGGGGGEKWGK